MVVPGHVKNGVIVLDDPITLPEGTAVAVEVVAASGESAASGPTLLERMQAVVGAAQSFPPDAATNVDHYLYGHPRP